jgi:hypothetical protein
LIALNCSTAADFEQLDLNDEWSDYEFEAMDDGDANKASKSHAASQHPVKNKKVEAIFELHSFENNSL